MVCIEIASTIRIESWACFGHGRPQSRFTRMLCLSLGRLLLQQGQENQKLMSTPGIKERIGTVGNQVCVCVMCMHPPNACG